MNEALEGAKSWGNYFLSVGKTATEVATKTVTSTATNLKKSMDQTILADFSREQEAFSEEKRAKENQTEVGVAPWVGYPEAESIRSQILALSEEKRNFVRAPPLQFEFDFSKSYSVALALLEEDERLKRMRFDLVPKQVSEETFWRNYFYRVSLVKQSAHLSSLDSADDEQANSKRDEAGAGATGDAPPQQQPTSPAAEAEEAVVGSPPHDTEFASDAFQSTVAAAPENESNKSPSVSSEKAEEDWEKELQDYEVLEGDGQLDEELEREILQQIEAENQ